MKYTQEVKDQAVEAAKNGTNLKEKQRTIGPNPKATQRYLKAAGIDFKELNAKLRAEGKAQSATKKQGKKTKASAEPTEEVIEE